MKDKWLIILSSILVIVIGLLIYVVKRSPQKDSGKTSDSVSVVDSFQKSFISNLFDTDTISNKDYTLKDFFSENAELNKKVDNILNTLKEEEKIGQMIIVAEGQYGNPKKQVIESIKNKRLGGIMLLKGSEGEFRNDIKDFIKIAKDNKSLPLIFSCDAEPSLLNNKISGSPSMSETSSIKTNEQANKISNQITNYIKNLGFNQNFAPVCDFNNNKEIIGDRSFGNIPEKVSELANIFISNSQDNNIVATAKHFPGHGNVKGDSHKGLVTIKGEPLELDVFRNVIKNNVISIMVGHIAISGSKNYDTEGKPSTISRHIVTDLLKKELNFKGIAITDAMNMKGVSDLGSPSLKAIKAGCDMILMPTNEEKLIKNILDECGKDKNLKNQITESVKKIIKLKICLGLIK